MVTVDTAAASSSPCGTRREARVRRPAERLSRRDRARRRDRTNLGGLRLLRLRHRLGPGVPGRGVSLREPADRHALQFRDLRPRLRGPADRFRDLHGGRPPPRARRQAHHRVVPARRVDRLDQLPAELRRYRVLVDRDAGRLPHRPGRRARRRLGRPRLAIGPERAAEPSGLVRHGARNSARPSASWWPAGSSPSSCSICRRRISCRGAGVIRSSSPSRSMSSRSSRGCGSWRPSISPN